MMKHALAWLSIGAFAFCAGAMVALVVRFIPADCGRRHTPRIEIAGWLVAGCP